MADVAQILGVGGGGGDDPTSNIRDPSRHPAALPPPPLPPPPPPHQHLPNRAMQKLQGSMSRELGHLLSGKDPDLKSASLPPLVPTFTPAGTRMMKTHVKVGSKWVSTQKPARPWAWAPFTSSARTDGALFYHWVRANVEYLDYPYSRFDVHLDPVVYTDEDYRRFLSDTEGWTKGETDALVDLARRFELRWAVIHDRWIASFPPRNIEDLQHRYYSVAAKMNQVRVAQEAAAEVQTLVAATPTTLSPSDDPSKVAATEGLLIEAAAARAIASSDGAHQPLVAIEGTGSSNKTFDLEAERERRAHLNALWNRSKEDEQEELEIRRELKQVEAQLRKLKKSGAHILAANALNAAGGAAGSGGAAMAGAGGAAPSAASSRNPSRSVSPQTLLASLDSTTTSLDTAFQSTAPVPTAQTPYLQSGRLVPPACGGASGINKALLARMDTVLGELKIEPSKLIPTKRVCDLFDGVRKDILTLLILQKTLYQREGALQSKRLKLAKMGGKVQVMDEEALMGIVPPPPPAPPAAPATAGAVPSSPAKGGAGKAKGASGRAKASPGSTGAAAGTKPKAKAKPKPKSDDGTAPASGTVPTATGKSGGVKDAPTAGKQPRKPSVKRKRKAEAVTSPASAPADAPVAATAPAPAAAEPGPATATKPDEGKQAKKRSKKAPPST